MARFPVTCSLGRGYGASGRRAKPRQKIPHMWKWGLARSEASITSRISDVEPASSRMSSSKGCEAFGAFLAKENARWSEAVKSAGVTVE